MKLSTIIQLVFASVFGFSLIVMWVCIINMDVPTTYFALVEAIVSFIGYIISTRLDK